MDLCRREWRRNHCSPVNTLTLCTAWCSCLPLFLASYSWSLSASLSSQAHRELHRCTFRLSFSNLLSVISTVGIWCRTTALIEPHLSPFPKHTPTPSFHSFTHAALCPKTSKLTKQSTVASAQVCTCWCGCLLCVCAQCMCVFLMFGARQHAHFLLSLFWVCVCASICDVDSVSWPKPPCPHPFIASNPPKSISTPHVTTTAPLLRQLPQLCCQPLFLPLFLTHTPTHTHTKNTISLSETSRTLEGWFTDSTIDPKSIPQRQNETCWQRS